MDGDKARRSGAERRIVYPVSAVCEQAVSDFRGVRMLARACADERGRTAGALPEDPVRRESRALIAAAKSVGCLLNLASVPGSRYTIRTGESEVRLVQKEQMYYKIKNPFTKLHLNWQPTNYQLYQGGYGQMNNPDNQRMATKQPNNRLIDKSKNLSRAFTIIELLVVIGIIGILMGILIGTFGGSSDSARAAKCQANMRNLAMAVQSYALANGHYPRASSIERYKESGKKDAEIVPGWLSGDNQNNPYLTGAEARRKCIESGAIWSGMKGDRGSYVCPSHDRYAKEKSLGAPLWSFQMNAYFDLGKNTGKPKSGEVRRRYGSFRRSDRYLLFAEIPYGKTKSGAEVDPVLDYEAGEEIAFYHKDGKMSVGHVCFADGHVEKLRSPKTGNVKNLTKWLCKPTDENGDFDISFDGKEYRQDRKQAE